MTFMIDALKSTPKAVRSIPLPRRAIFRADSAGTDIPYHPSPVDWAGEVLYFLLPDRFSDALDHGRPPFDYTKPPGSARPAGFRWDKWAESGGGRWQGGTLKGIASRLDYLSHLGITAVWIGPVFKQRKHNNEYHGYAIQNFLEVDPHFGTRKDLVDLVIAAHQRGIRVILDVIFNHSGHNWDYKEGQNPPYLQWPEYYKRGPWLDDQGNHASGIGNNPEYGVWPEELQRDECYTRAGKGSLAVGDVNDDHCEMKRTDYLTTWLPGHSHLNELGFYNRRLIDCVVRGPILNCRRLEPRLKLRRSLFSFASGVMTRARLKSRLLYFFPDVFRTIFFYLSHVGRNKPVRAIAQ